MRGTYSLKLLLSTTTSIAIARRQRATGHKHAYFELEQPSMALNASDSPVRYQMKYSLKVISGMSVREVMSWPRASCAI